MKSRKKTVLPEFNMTISEAISYIKSRTCLIEWMHAGDYIQSEQYQLRKSLNGRSFILNAADSKLELFISVSGWTIQSAIEDFDAASCADCTERGIYDADLAAVRLTPKKYKK